jgi:hypothetical protein
MSRKFKQNKMKYVIKFFAFTILILGLTTMTSCKKEYAKYDNMEVVENSFDGNLEITSVGQDPAGDFWGNNKNGTYSFAWNNPKKKASANFDVTTSGGGTVQMIIKDAKGNEVLNETRPQGGNDTFSGVSEEGKEGMWLVTLIFTNLSGDGSFSIHPGN